MVTTDQIVAVPHSAAQVAAMMQGRLKHRKDIKLSITNSMQAQLHATFHSHILEYPSSQRVGRQVFQLLLQLVPLLLQLTYCGGSGQTATAGEHVVEQF